MTEGYAGPEVCRQCHAAIADSYRSVAMAQSFSRPSPGTVIEDYTRASTLHHEASGYTYEMRREGGRFFQRRYERYSAGRRKRVFDREVTFIIGSGRHTRTYLHLDANGELTQLPVSWYPQEGRWGMSPGYDRRDQPDFFRPVTYRCLFCHNAYPDVPRGADSAISVALYPRELPSGIDCQRCHGPGRRHVDLARRPEATLEEVRGSVVNPARLPPARQMDICMQCHLEATSAGAWEALVAFGRGVFSFRPGEDLAAYRRHFDFRPGVAFPPGAAPADRFEIAHQAYRLRQAACFRQSAGRMTCTTCHDPHRRPERPGEFFMSKCLSCHEREECGPGHEAAARGTGEGCTDCHMPKRRTDDVVLVTMTDHLIRRRHPPREARLAPRREAAEAYRGPIAFCAPEDVPPGNEKDLYLGVASLMDDVDRRTGERLLEKAVAALRPMTPEPYFQLGLSLLSGGRLREAVRHLERAASLDSRNPRILLSLGNALGRAGRPEEALARYDAALAAWPGYSEAHTNAGNVLVQSGRLPEALERYRTAIALRADNAEAHSNLGAVLFRIGRAEQAEAELREALRINPAHAEAASNLARVLLARSGVEEAVETLREGESRNPRHVGILSRLAWILATSARDTVRDGRRALTLAERAARLTARRDPRVLDALAAALAETGRTAEAAREAGAARRLALASGQADLAKAIEGRRGVYERGHPYRE
ncbi:MAG: tetratricopeptide repeat protein [Acidobacteria bacterium]|nr:tetratricopeptide repeat protein [Acidobacteriota bacterium]